MKLVTKHIGILIITVTFFMSCEETVEVPVEPAVSFKSFSVVEFEEEPEFFQLQFDLTDGDGDIGLLPEQDFVPFHEFDLILDADNQLVRKSNEVSPPFFRLRPNGERFFFSEEDERPAFDLFNYMLMDTIASGVELSDTVMIHRNLFHNNIYVSVLRKEGENYLPAGGRDSRPLISGRFSMSGGTAKVAPIISAVSFPIAADQFKHLSLQDTLKLEFYIFDRNLNQSNIEVTPEFRLSDLLSDEAGD